MIKEFSINLNVTKLYPYRNYCRKYTCFKAEDIALLGIGKISTRQFFQDRLK